MFGPPRRLHYSVFEAPGCTVRNLGAQYAVRRQKVVTNSALVEATLGRMPDPTVEEAYVAELRNARYFGNAGGCVVAEDDGVIWTHSPTNYTFRLSLHHAFSRLRLGPLKRYRKVIHLVTRSAESNYWHWMVDCVPRFRLLKAAGVNIQDAVLLVEHRNLPYQLETLRALGFSEEAVIVPDAKTHLETDTLIVPSYLNPVLTPETITYSRESLEFLRETFLPARDEEGVGSMTKGAERIYVSRGRGVRSFANDEEVANYLQGEGFTVVRCEELSVREQARTFARARVVVGLHGAALTNVVFCQPGATVVEIMPPDFVQPHFWTICEQAGLRYAAYCEDEKRTGVAGYRFQRTEGTAVDVARFGEFLGSILKP